jgi:glutamate-5-semialdehyde dehydrogenase
MLLEQVKLAKNASYELASFSSAKKNEILKAIAQELASQKDKILAQNAIDISNAKKAQCEPSLLDRLALDSLRIDAMIASIEKLISLPDPIGQEIEKLESPMDISIKKVRVPLGVIAMIYEARPNVTVEAAALCIKSGNAVILKGGREAVCSNECLSEIVIRSAERAGLPKEAVFSISSLDREAVNELLKIEGLIDLIIPRGGGELINFVKKNTTIPVLSHGKGLCSLYIDKDADVDMAIEIALNAKCQRPAVCNAVETVLVHKDIAPKIIGALCNKYIVSNVIIKGDERVVEFCKQYDKNMKILPALEQDWLTEYHGLTVAIKIVDSLEDAILHINQNGSHHTDSIITNNSQTAEKFLNKVDSAAVMVNASTRLHDGSVFGLGSEIGISTQKLHARGTMGIKELTTTKYIVEGKGNIRK